MYVTVSSAKNSRVGRALDYDVHVSWYGSYGCHATLYLTCSLHHFTLSNRKLTFSLSPRHRAGCYMGFKTPLHLYYARGLIKICVYHHVCCEQKKQSLKLNSVLVYWKVSSVTLIFFNSTNVPCIQ